MTILYNIPIYIVKQKNLTIYYIFLMIYDYIYMYILLSACKDYKTFVMFFVNKNFWLDLTWQQNKSL